ncbi:hypothetical protein DFJ73DRAFT_191174 [Zopfochytrium polystomum]|nr:hypothetical protein DFJ73DRAFT_191174 [Zopfochytrium polystomum]
MDNSCNGAKLLTLLETDPAIVKENGWDILDAILSDRAVIVEPNTVFETIAKDGRARFLSSRHEEVPGSEAGTEANDRNTVRMLAAMRSIATTVSPRETILFGQERIDSLAKRITTLAHSQGAEDSGSEGSQDDEHSDTEENDGVVDRLLGSVSLWCAFVEMLRIAVSRLESKSPSILASGLVETLVKTGIIFLRSLMRRRLRNQNNENRLDQMAEVAIFLACKSLVAPLKALSEKDSTMSSDKATTTALAAEYVGALFSGCRLLPVEHVDIVTSELQLLAFQSFDLLELVSLAEEQARCSLLIIEFTAEARTVSSTSSEKVDDSINWWPRVLSPSFQLWLAAMCLAYAVIPPAGLSRLIDRNHALESACRLVEGAARAAPAGSFYSDDLWDIPTHSVPQSSLGAVCKNLATVMGTCPSQQIRTAAHRAFQSLYSMLATTPRPLHSRLLVLRHILLPSGHPHVAALAVSLLRKELSMVRRLWQWDLEQVQEMVAIVLDSGSWLYRFENAGDADAVEEVKRISEKAVVLVEAVNLLFFLKIRGQTIQEALGKLHPGFYIEKCWRPMLANLKPAKDAGVFTPELEVLLFSLERVVSGV